MSDSDATGSNTTSGSIFSTEIVNLIGRIGDDWGDNSIMRCVEPVAMLKALLALHFRREVAQNPTPLNEAEKYGEAQFTGLLDTAVKYCNDPKDSVGLKNGIKAWLSDSKEGQGRRAFAEALNSVLLTFHEKRIGEGRDSLYVCSDRETNQPNSSSIIVDLTLEELDTLLPGHNYLTFGQWVEGIKYRHGELENAWTSSLKEKQTSWGDISHCWELRRSMILSKKELHRLDEKYEAMNVVSPSSKSLKVPSGRARSRFPPSSSEAEPALEYTSLAKRLREDSSDATRRNKRQKVDIGDFETFEVQKEYISPETQCALYAAQLLRSRWNRTHAIVFLLTDNWLSLRWYDAQGSILTSSIDIVAQLPLLVVMIVLFQRFGDRMRGIGDFKLEAKVGGSHFRYSIPDTTHSGWKLSGRRRVTATPKFERLAASTDCRQNSPATNTDGPFLPDEELFFKLSWREEVRDSEGLIIQTAKERAIKYLGDNAGDVLNHLPDIKHYEDYSQFSTRHIREHLGLGKEGARVPSVLLSERLVPLEDVEPDEFPARMWEIIRCHYLLWQIGVAHGDISLWNLMVGTASGGAERKGRGFGRRHFAVLNDFDLATIMEPGQEFPSRIGFERTGTRPFMALDLLNRKDETIKGQYLHDLEAMIWCMVWFLEPQPKWTHGSMREVGDRKISASLLFKADEPSEWATENEAEHLWTSVIRILKAWILSRPVTVETIEARRNFTDHDNLLLFHKHLPYPERPEKKDWDSRWMGWRIPTGGINIVAHTEAGKDEGKN